MLINDKTPNDRAAGTNERTDITDKTRKLRGTQTTYKTKRIVSK